MQFNIGLMHISYLPTFIQKALALLKYMNNIRLHVAELVRQSWSSRSMTNNFGLNF